MSYKITLEPGVPTPKVKNRGGFIFENCRGGPYKYGDPIELNAEALRRLHAKEGRL